MGKAFMRIFLAFAFLLAFSSCEDIDSFFEESASGRNVLSFTLNGEKVYQARSGGFPSEYPLCRHATYRFNPDSSSVTVEASLHGKCFSWISFSLPAGEVEKGAVIFPEISMEYLYLSQIAHWGTPEVGDGYTATPLIIDRQAEYRYATIKTSKVRIRRWDPDARVLAGNFTMEGQYKDSTGRVIPFKVTDGMFDVTDDIYPN